MALVLSDEELDRLMEEHEYYYKLYVHCLRRHMDYSTGIVGGIKRRICYKSLMEDMYVAPRRGVSTNETGLRTRSDFQRALKHLQRIGLIEQINNSKNREWLIFKLPLAHVGDSRPKQTRYISDTDADTEADTAYIKQDAVMTGLKKDFELQADTKADTLLKTKPIPLCISDKSKEIQILKEQSICTKKTRKQIPENFTVTDQHVHLARENQWPHPDSEIAAFRDYHMARGTTMLDWDRAFYTWLRNAVKFKGGNRSGTYQQPERKNSFDRAIENILNSPTRAR